MSKYLFDFTDYRAFLRSAFPVKGPERGGRIRLAEALGCKPGFVSLVLTEGAHFSLEHAIKTCQFLELSDEERDFFLLLVSFARAGSKDLETYFKSKINETLSRRRLIRERIQVKTELSDKDQLIYYSSWHYIAVHMSLFISELQTKAALARHFNLSVQSITRVLEFLLQAGLAEQNGERFNAKPSRTHLPSDSPLVSKHHSNWRMKAIQALDEPERSDLHFSSVMSISSEALEKVRESLLSSLQQMEPVIREAKDEKACVICIDLFVLK